MLPKPPMEIMDLSAVRQTGESIAEWQLPSGMIPWFPNGHADPWNHIEAAMALDISGLQNESIRAYQWLADIQLKDGSWHNYYLDDGIEQDKIDSNCVAYIATGVLHHYLVSKDKGFLETMWDVVEPAIDFVLELQTPRGEIIWARHSDGTPWSYALLTGSSSISHSLRSAIAIANELGLEKPQWEKACQKLIKVLQTMPDAFAPKERWAMDWYYPVLTGVLRGGTGIDHLKEKSEIFEIESRGIRCVSDRPWVTTAETCECAMAYQGVGDMAHAISLFEQIQDYRNEDGRYLTGMVYPDYVSFPEDEHSTYSAAAVIITADSLIGLTDASQIFSNHDFLPVI
ncbi:MAG: prenyltransferase [Actinomycetota bacterium]|nr:prenyltransferase [Actinomycetota bacterium]